MKVLFAASEIYPYAKTGGLADVAAALPKALGRHCEIYRVMPKYRFIDIPFQKCDIGFEVFGRRVEIYRHETTYFIYEERLCERDYPYGEPGSAYEDNWLRFAIFSAAIAKLSWILGVDLLHLNDWHTALAAIYAPCKKIFTIHNLAYQGIFEASVAKELSLGPYFTMEGLEFYGKVNYLKAGIAYSDHVTTVSPTYAKEIQTPAFGCGLDGFLKKHASKLTGILNGIDYDIFDPAKDPLLPYHFDVATIGRKKEIKKTFFEDDNPLFIFIGRFVEQKGIDTLIEALPELLAKELNLFILGEGEERFEKAVTSLKAPNYKAFIGYKEILSHQLYAAADFLLMPSRFEPCGLNQMIAMRYGTIPIVRPVGGLRDSVYPIGSGRCGEGFWIRNLLKSVEDALKYHPKSQEIRRFDMGCDFSIDRCAKEYYRLYERIMHEDGR